MSEEVKKKGMSTGAKWGTGCGIGCLTVIIIIAVVAFIGFRLAKGKLDEVTLEMKELGFENVVQQQMIEVKDEITEPTLYVGQMVKIIGDCSTNLAIVAQMAEIHGKVAGKVYFRGQMLTIQPEAELLNGLDVKAQVVQKYGKIHGEITGEGYALDDKSEQ
jgi:hypothetical protein